MTARDDYPVPVHQELARMYKAYDALVAENAAEHQRMVNEIDDLRSSCAALNDEVNHWVAMSNADAELHRQLRESYDALVSNSAVEHQPMSTVCSKCARFHIGASCRPPRSEAE